MGRVVGGFALAILLAVAAVFIWREAGRVRETADAHRRLVTLRYERADGLTGAPSQSRWTSLLSALRGERPDRRAAVSYWFEDYRTVADAQRARAVPPTPGLRFIAANAAFRASAPAEGDPKARVARLDAVVQAYADVLRDDPANDDAAYNYELVLRLRDGAARAKPGARSAQRQPAAESLESASFDLPPGPTIHGRPGGPPATVPMGEFKATTPMNYEEREQMPEPTAGSRLRRRG